MSLIVSAIVGACATAAAPSGSTIGSQSPSDRPTSPQPSASATSAPSAPAPSPSLATSIALRKAPADLGCDAIGIDYKTVTFRIDPAATEQVAAQTDTGVTLTTYWAVGFEPGTDTERNIRDPNGELVVSDGDMLQVPAAGYPRLQGYFVCLAPDKLYVLLTDPT
jgi:hypothetical protein